jgi:hypothetical protein
MMTSGSHPAMAGGTDHPGKGFNGITPMRRASATVVRFWIGLAFSA